MRSSIQRLIAAAVLIAFGVVGRICLRVCLPPGNDLIMFDMFAVVVVSTLLAGCLLGGVLSFIVPICIMLISDLYYGNTYIFLFTWSGFAFVGLLGYALKNKVNYTSKFILNLTGIGILGVLIYDIWTAFGCWLGWYPHTIGGLALCYTLQIPFTIGHLISTAVVVPLVAIPATYIYKQGIPTIKISISKLEHYATLTSIALLTILSVVQAF